MDQVFEELRPRRFLAGEEIVAEGAPLTSLLLLSSGVCQVRWQGLPEEQEPRLGPGSLLGDVSFLLGGTTRAQVVALEPVECLELSRDALERVAEESPVLAARIYRALAAINAQRLI
ncbi:MAG TPA: cyclic nucleotide-binding domain-containing protein, partial [Prochlorococcus sp.]